MTVSLRLVMTQEGSIKNGSLKNYFNQPAFILSSSHRNCLFLPHAPSKISLHYPQPPPHPLLIMIWCVFHHFLNEIESARVPAEMYIKVKIMKPKYWTRTQFISHFQTFLFQHKCKIYFRTSVLHVLFEMFEVNWNTHTQTTLKKLLTFGLVSSRKMKRNIWISPSRSLKTTAWFLFFVACYEQRSVNNLHYIV